MTYSKLRAIISTHKVLVSSKQTIELNRAKGLTEVESAIYDFTKYYRIT